MRPPVVTYCAGGRLHTACACPHGQHFAEGITLCPSADQSSSIESEPEFALFLSFKLFSALYGLGYDIIPSDPNHKDFRLHAPLAKFRRIKGHGLPRRYRVFFVFLESAKTIIFLYVNDERTLRRQGDSRDPYARFTALVQQGLIGDDFDSNYRIWGR